MHIFNYQYRPVLTKSCVPKPGDPWTVREGIQHPLLMKGEVGLAVHSFFHDDNLASLHVLSQTGYHCRCLPLVSIQVEMAGPANILSGKLWARVGIRNPDSRPSPSQHLHAPLGLLQPMPQHREHLPSPPSAPAVGLAGFALHFVLDLSLTPRPISRNHHRILPYYLNLLHLGIHLALSFLLSSRIHVHSGRSYQGFPVPIAQALRHATGGTIAP